MPIRLRFPEIIIKYFDRQLSYEPYDVMDIKQLTDRIRYPGGRIKCLQ